MSNENRSGSVFTVSWGATSCTPMACLSVMLQILQCLPSILWNLSFQAGILSMFAYGPNMYKFQPWGSGGDSISNLDTDA